MVRPYKLKEYTVEDFTNPLLFRKEYCAVCGHHLPIVQSMKVGKDWVHSDIRICLALYNRSGPKLANILQLKDRKEGMLSGSKMTDEWDESEGGKTPKSTLRDVGYEIEYRRRYQ